MGASARPLLVDDEAYGYDDSDRESEFLEGILGGAAQALGGGISGIGNLIGGVGNLLNPPAPRPPIPPVQPGRPGPGVTTATIDTPRGSATLRLPDSVVTVDEFRTATQNLQDAINRNTARLNSTQKDIESLAGHSPGHNDSLRVTWHGSFVRRAGAGKPITARAAGHPWRGWEG